MNNVSKKILSYLDSCGIQYRILEHKAAASVMEYQQTLGTRIEQQANALLFRYKRTGGKGFAVVTLPAQKKLDLEAVRVMMKANEVRLGTAKQLEETTGCSYGQLPPLGKVFGLPLYFDKDLLIEPEIYFNAGSLSLSVVLDPKSLVECEVPNLF